MIKLIGTGHVFNLSEILFQTFDEMHPDLICVELDQERYQALLLKKTNPQAYYETRKTVPILYKLFARFQDSLAKEYGVIAGAEMLTAVQYAQTHQIPFELIDMNAQTLFTSMIRSMSLREKFRLLLSGIGGIFIRKKQVEREMEKIECNFDAYLNQIADKFPTIKRILIDERNLYMARKVIEFSDQYQHIVVILGDGHVPGISKIFRSQSIEFEVTRLKELRQKIDKEDDSSSAYFSINYRGI